MIENWGTEGEIDLLDFFAELTIYTSTACLIGRKFREQLDSRFAGWACSSAAPIRSATSTRTCRSRASGSAMRPRQPGRLVQRS